MGVVPWGQIMKICRGYHVTFLRLRKGLELQRSAVSSKSLRKMLKILRKDYMIYSFLLYLAFVHHPVTFAGILSPLDMPLQVQDQDAPLWENMEERSLATPLGKPQGSLGQELEYSEEG